MNFTGFIFGDLEMNDYQFRLLCVELQVSVLLFEYRYVCQL
jgi:acetyl esterase/lipase